MATSKLKEIESREKRRMAAILTDLYSTHKTQKAVAEELGVSQGTVSLWIAKLGLQIDTNRNLIKRAES